MQNWDDLAVFVPTNLEQWREEHDDEAEADNPEDAE